MKRKGSLFGLATWAASPQGRRKIGQLRQRLDTPANRQKALSMKDKILAKRRPKR